MTIRYATIMTLSLLLAAGSATAQYELDNSLQAGSGGINQPQQQPDYGAGNDIVTGNVTGLDYFHGDVGYRAAGEFRGQTGSNDLFRFRAQSAPVNQNLQPGHVQTLRPTPIYRDQSGVSGADVTQPGLGGASIIQPHSRAYHQYDPTLAPGAAPVYTASPAPDRLMLMPSEDGNLYEVYATPMLGMRSRVVGRLPQGPASELDAQQQIVPERTDQSAAPPPDADALDFDFDFLDGSSPREPTPTDEPRVDSSVRPRRVTAIGPGLLDLVQSSRIDGTTEGTLAERAAEIEAQLYSPLGSRTVEPGQDVYLDLLVEMQRRGRALDAGDGTTELRIDDEPRATTAPRVPLAPPSSQVLAAAEAERRRAMGLPAEDEQDGEGEPADDVRMNEALERLLAKLDAQGPPVRTLAGDAEAEYNDQMRRGERAMVAGRYFDAEARFIAAGVSAPTQPLPRVGQIHAQMGAGLVRTAATNLRNLFVDHPELIATRYLPTLLPEEARLVWLRERLEEMIGLADTPEPALLMAYLGYQTGNRELTVFGLDKAQARTPDDPLLPVLRRLWLK